MFGHRFSRRLLVAAAVTLGVVVAGGVPGAVAHTHPTPIERAAPAVVFIEARALVDVALIEHHQQGDPSGVHIGIIQSTWNPVLASASGFVVDPNGAIVTAAAVTKPDLERAKIYAVNQAFHKQYGAAAPLPANPFARHHVGGSADRVEERLQACYPPNVTNDAGGCVVRAVLDLVVYPYVTSQQRYGNLKAEVLPGATKDVAVLRVRGANSMPTVAVAQSLVGASALGVLGFTGVPSASSPLLEINQHLAKPGTGDLKTTGLDAQDVKDATHLKQALSQGLSGGPVVAERGQVIGFLAGPPRAGRPAPDLVSVAAILPVLKAAKVAPHSGPADTSYEDAMHLFKNGAYAAAIPASPRPSSSSPATTGPRPTSPSPSSVRAPPRVRPRLGRRSTSRPRLPQAVCRGCSSRESRRSSSLWPRRCCCCGAGGEAALPAWARPGRVTAGLDREPRRMLRLQPLPPAGRRGRPHRRGTSPARSLTPAGPRRPAPASAAGPSPTPMRVPIGTAEPARGPAGLIAAAGTRSPRSLRRVPLLHVVRGPAGSAAPVLRVVR